MTALLTGLIAALALLLTRLARLAALLRLSRLIALLLLAWLLVRVLLIGVIHRDTPRVDRLHEHQRPRM